MFTAPLPSSSEPFSLVGVFEANKKDRLVGARWLAGLGMAPPLPLGEPRRDPQVYDVVHHKTGSVRTSFPFKPKADRIHFDACKALGKTDLSKIDFTNVTQSPLAPTGSTAPNGRHPLR